MQTSFLRLFQDDQQILALKGHEELPCEHEEVEDNASCLNVA